MTNNELPLAVLKFNTPLNCALMVFAAFRAVRKLFVELHKTDAELLKTGRRNCFGRARNCFGRERNCFGRARNCFGRERNCFGRACPNLPILYKKWSWYQCMMVLWRATDTGICVIATTQITVICPNCSSSSVVKNGCKSNGNQKYRRRSCGKQFLQT